MNDIVRKFDHRIKNPDPHIVALLAEIDGIRGEFKSGLMIKDGTHTAEQIAGYWDAASICGGEEHGTHA